MSRSKRCWMRRRCRADPRRLRLQPQRHLHRRISDPPVQVHGDLLLLPREIPDRRPRVQILHTAIRVQTLHNAQHRAPQIARQILQSPADRIHLRNIFAPRPLRYGCATDCAMVALRLHRDWGIGASGRAPAGDNLAPCAPGRSGGSGGSSDLHRVAPRISDDPRRAATIRTDRAMCNGCTRGSQGTPCNTGGAERHAGGAAPAPR